MKFALTLALLQALTQSVEERKQKIEALDRLRETLGYRETLKRGYAVVHGEDGVLTSKKAAGKSAPQEIEFADGRFKLGSSPAKPRKGSTQAKPPEQGSLF